MQMGQGRVLIVDDNGANRDILRRVLRKDYELEFAASGEECLRRLDEFRPQVVILDVMMPGLDGLQTCQRIKAATSDRFCQVILVSGKGSTAQRLEGYAATADDYLVKPFDHDELRYKVRSQVRLWQRFDLP